MKKHQNCVTSKTTSDLIALSDPCKESVRHGRLLLLLFILFYFSGGGDFFGILFYFILLFPCFQL